MICLYTTNFLRPESKIIGVRSTIECESGYISQTSSRHSIFLKKSLQWLPPCRRPFPSASIPIQLSASSPDFQENCRRAFRYRRLPAATLRVLSGEVFALCLLLSRPEKLWRRPNLKFPKTGRSRGARRLGNLGRSSGCLKSRAVSMKGWIESGRRWS